MLRVLVRRWYVIVPMLLMTALGGWLVTSMMEPEYESTASLVLLGPNMGKEGAVNPYLDFGGSHETTAFVLASNLSSETVVERLYEAGATGTYLVTASGGPIIGVQATGRDEAEAMRTGQVVVTAVTDELRVLQERAGGPPESFLRAETVLYPDTASFRVGSKIRVLVAIGVLGIAASLSVTFAFESISRARQQRRMELAQPKVVRLNGKGASPAARDAARIAVVPSDDRGRRSSAARATAGEDRRRGDGADVERVLQERPPGAWIVTLD